MARPSEKSDTVVEHIIGELIDGKSLRQICDADDMPNRRTVMRWLEVDDDFATKYARARVLQADLMDDKINELIETVTPASAPADRVKLAALQWRAAKLEPKKYGDKLALGGDSNAPLVVKIVRFGDAGNHTSE